MMKLQAMMSSQKLGSSWSALLWSVWWETTKGPVVVLPHQVPGHNVHLAAGHSVGDAQYLLVLLLHPMQKWVQPGFMHQNDVGCPFPLHVWLQVSYTV